MTRLMMAVSAARRPFQVARQPAHRALIGASKSKRGYRGRDQDGQSRSIMAESTVSSGSRAASQHRHPHQQRHVLRSGVPGEGQLVITVARASDFGRSSPCPKTTIDFSETTIQEGPFDSY